MSPHHQRQIVQQLCDKLRDGILTLVDEGRIPEDWDGVELRRYICDRAEENIPMGKMSGKRLKAYKSDLLVRNL